MFVNNRMESRAKRAAMIDKLIAREEFVNHWSVKWSDLLQVNRTKLGDKGVWAFREWIREALIENRPYDKMVRELITARGSTYRNPPANFFRFTREPKVAMETTTQLFLGVRMACAQCHDHPFEQWTQNQYYNLSAFFGKLAVKAGEAGDEEVVYDKREEFEILHPKDGRVMPAKFLYDVGDDERARGGSAREPRRLADLAEESAVCEVDGEPALELLLRSRHHRAGGRHSRVESAVERGAARCADEGFSRSRLRFASLDPHDRQLAYLSIGLPDQRVERGRRIEFFPRAAPPVDRRAAVRRRVHRGGDATEARMVPKESLAQDLPDPAVGQRRISGHFRASGAADQLRVRASRAR